jgi:hypothetical protein
MPSPRLLPLELTYDERRALTAWSRLAWAIGTAVPAETGQAVARRALGCQPRLLDDPRDGTERRLKLFWRGIPPDRDDDREASPE